MGYLQSKEIVVEAVLTSKGREKIANGQPLGITKFALADDEVDYRLYNPDHPNGTEFAGDVITNMPLMEAFVDETQVMRYKLVSLPKDTSRMPVVSVASNSYNIVQGTPVSLEPVTNNGSDATLGYTAILHNAEVASLEIAPGGETTSSTGTIPVFLSDNETTRTQTQIGTRFLVRAKSVTEDVATKVTIIGNQTGGSTTVSILIKAASGGTT